MLTEYMCTLLQSCLFRSTYADRVQVYFVAELFTLTEYKCTLLQSCLLRSTYVDRVCVYFVAELFT